MVVEFFSRNYQFIKERERERFLDGTCSNELIGDAIAKL